MDLKGISFRKGFVDPEPGGLRIGISSCLLGENVRYDGGHKLDRFLRDTLGQSVEYVPVCPEFECGLGVPRESMHLVGDPGNPRLVTTRTGIDLTDRMVKWSKRKVGELQSENLSGFIFKSRSPSSGMERVKVTNDKGQPVNKGVGIFARVFMESFPMVPVEDEGRLHDPVFRENFIEAVFTLGRWRALARGKKRVGNLVRFHTEHKLLLLAHSRKHYAAMGRLVAGERSMQPEGLYREYGGLLVEALKLKATRKKNTDVLMHAMGYFKKVLDGNEKEELLTAIHQYRKELVPLVVPLTLIRHHIRKHGQPYLEGQIYFHPNPLEIILRNHV
ncbi:MAG: DUF523 and DUF1722 domain-containing protein [bacterium]|nr:DUF523 and DUF1722 domain-containing protein [bacterium]